MYRLNNILRILTLVICIFAFTFIAQGGVTIAGGRDTGGNTSGATSFTAAAAQTGSGTVGGGEIQNQGGTVTISNAADSILPAGGSLPHNNLLSDLSTKLFASPWTNGVPLTGF
jgi:hypothetical protein